MGILSTKDLRYSIKQDIENNRIMICVPQTLDSITSTVGEISKRRNLTDNELLSVLELVRYFCEH